MKDFLRIGGAGRGRGKEEEEDEEEEEEEEVEVEKKPLKSGRRQASKPNGQWGRSEGKPVKGRDVMG